MSSSITFDTFEFNKALRDGGFDERQAETLTKAQAKAMEQSSKEADYVSRSELKTDIQDLRKDMQSLETGLRKDMQLLEQGIRKDMQTMEERITANLYKAMMMQTVAIGGLVVAVIKFMQP
jgi:hypothetical protein